MPFTPTPQNIKQAERIAAGTAYEPDDLLEQYRLYVARCEHDGDKPDTFVRFAIELTLL